MVISVLKPKQNIFLNLGYSSDNACIVSEWHYIGSCGGQSFWQVCHRKLYSREARI